VGLEAVPRYQRRSAEVNEAVASAYLAGANTRRIQGALRPLLKAAPLSKSAVSRVVGTLRSAWEAWTKRSLADLDVAYLYLDALALRVRSAGKARAYRCSRRWRCWRTGRSNSWRWRCAGASRTRRGRASSTTWLSAGSRRRCSASSTATLACGARSLVWGKTPVQRCCVHKLRNLVRKAPEHAREEITDDFHRIVYAASEGATRESYGAFTSKWKSRCPGVVRSLEEAGESSVADQPAAVLCTGRAGGGWCAESRAPRSPLGGRARGQSPFPPPPALSAIPAPGCTGPDPGPQQ
jgi:hypothetical protein